MWVRLYEHMAYIRGNAYANKTAFSHSWAELLESFVIGLSTAHRAYKENSSDVLCYVMYYYYSSYSKPIAFPLLKCMLFLLALAPNNDFLCHYKKKLNPKGNIDLDTHIHRHKSYEILTSKIKLRFSSVICKFVDTDICS